MPLLGIAPRHRTALRKIVAAHLALGQPAAAWPFAHRLARVEPPDASDLTFAGLAFLHCRDDAAAATLRRALTLEPAHAMAARVLLRAPGAGTDPAAIAALLAHAPVDEECRAALHDACRAAGEPIAFAHVQEGRVAGAAAGSGPVAVRLRWNGLTVAEGSTRPAGGGCFTFALDVPAALRGTAPLVVEVDAVPLVHGSPIAATATLAPRLDHAAVLDADGLKLHARDAAAPARPVPILVRFADGRTARHVLPPDPAAPPATTAEAPALLIPLRDAAGTRVTFAATGEPLWAPVLAPTATPGPSPRVDIIIPVYADLAATQACLESVLSAPPDQDCEIVVIDDDTPEPAIARLLGGLAAAGRITLLRNPGNLGFVRSVNRGMALHPDRDVVLLNADTLVQGDWLGRLRRAVCGAPDIATATPLSNDATILSYPKLDTPVPLADTDVPALDRLAAQTLGDRVVEIPTAVGFCMYIRRACLDQTGYFDAAAFGQGYGEENDFCLRATALGWRHVAALGVFVGHAGSASFGASKLARIRVALQTLEDRHPGYAKTIADFEAADPLAPARRALDLAQLQNIGSFPVLILCARLGGGTARYVDEQVARLRAEGMGTIIARPEEAAPDASPARHARMRLEVPGFASLNGLTYALPAERDRLLADLRGLGVQHMILHHLLGLDADTAAALCAAWPYRVHIHDYSWICPRINLVDGSGRYCGEPAVTVCNRCVADNGAELAHGVKVEDWRTFTRGLLDAADLVICPSTDTAARITRYAPAAGYAVVPHAEPPVEPLPAIAPTPGVRRVAVIGAVNEVKGYEVLRACAEDAARRNLPLEFVLIGYSKDDFRLFETGRIFITGKYREGEAAGLARQLGCQLALLPSVWPETWCYALTEAWRAGLTTVAFDLGAQAERMRGRAGTILMPLGLAEPAINDALMAVPLGTGVSETTTMDGR